jgi:hypothetical protein
VRKLIAKDAKEDIHVNRLLESGHYFEESGKTESATNKTTPQDDWRVIK